MEEYTVGGHTYRTGDRVEVLMIGEWHSGIVVTPPAGSYKPSGRVPVMIKPDWPVASNARIQQITDDFHKSIQWPTDGEIRPA